MPNRNVADYVKRREINEGVRDQLQHKLHVTDSFVHRLGLEKELEGHQGCVNCLEWNSEGRILASASDDFQVILWDPFRHRKIQTIQTIHHGNIFSVKFLPGTNDNTLVTGAGDFQVHTIDVTLKETTQVCACATGRVKRLATAPQVPFLFWSASEDGAVRQYDMRSPHSCSGDVTNVLVYLRTHLGHFAEAKCLAVNPLRPEILAVGANDPYVRLYDRRMIRLTKIYLSESLHSQRARLNVPPSQPLELEDNLPRECVQYFVAGHIPVKQKDLQKKFRNLAATYVTFGSKGTDLLLNLGGEQIYLFDITRKQKPKAFDLPKPSFSKGEKDHGSTSNGYSNGYHPGTNGYSTSSSKKDDSKLKLPDHVEAMKLTANMLFEKEEYGPAIRVYNEAIQHYASSPVLYGNRAAAYMKRDWDGDMYAALRDCHTTLHLDCNHVKAFFRLARCLNELHWTDEAKQCLEMFKQRFPNHVNSHACRALEKDIFMATMSSSPEGSEEDSDDLEMAKDGDLGLDGILSRISSQERHWREGSYDYDKRFYGHCNTTTDIKEANFFGSEGQYIIAGSDDGSVYFWDRRTTNNVRILRGDSSIVNCLQPHPTYCLLASSGIDPLVRLWSPLPENQENTHEVRDKDAAASSNQRRMKADPFDVVLMGMGYQRVGSGEESGDEASGPTYNCHTS
ncbi:WD and tetratricopeptide repeats protein 1-like isoform X1 [Macrosteles quadrilineatus]|uniref:WD and tetratricopeptide repeats protein 1-like isoform X1 n=1 Tax=Macrosteles quadrilineatus TaxID=74068 RepID=UPI0023E13A9D|nr:WD and tetratricopeptide repeats protein 1-like isoform X1 [Macrosteles quadrilineatus]